MAAEKVIRLEKTDLTTEVARRGPRLPWSILAGQLGGKLQVHSREWMEFQVTFPQSQERQGGKSA